MPGGPSLPFTQNPAVPVLSTFKLFGSVLHMGDTMLDLVQRLTKRAESCMNAPRCCKTGRMQVVWRGPVENKKQRKHHGHTFCSGSSAAQGLAQVLYRNGPVACSMHPWWEPMLCAYSRLACHSSVMENICHRACQSALTKSGL